MFILRNYNRFLVGSKDNFKWEDFYIHRFKSDFKRLVKFDSLKEVEEFIQKHPDIEKDFDAWAVQTDPEDWG